MPELDGIGVVRALKRSSMPLVAFVTAFDAFAVNAFELNAIDYLLKPVSPARLRDTLNRVEERLERPASREDELNRLEAATDQYQESRRGVITRIPVKDRDQILLVPVERVASIVADGELLHLTTLSEERYLLSFRLKDLESRLDPGLFVRLNRGTIVAIDAIASATSMPGGTYSVLLKSGERFPVSRSQSAILRQTLFKL
jgi:two-component system LytT family response regulator